MRTFSGAERMRPTWVTTVGAMATSMAWGLVAAVAAYPALRILQFLATSRQDPSAVVWSVHSGFFWRALIVAYGGGFVAFVGWVIARRHIEAAARALAFATLAAALLLALQALFVP